MTIARFTFAVLRPERVDTTSGNFRLPETREALVAKLGDQGVQVETLVAKLPTIFMTIQVRKRKRKKENGR